ncbi:hypothetical protein FEMY_10530 [Ferrovum myxofaciens]|uniref:Uncharacterized protein n=1 Tax=Ferrovum myxofaciens TaxID=416213 RepID=A0A149VYZ0_9PROT|nr:hypothetical protein FEMY_10530 [Ferrovum myxofaciens]
MNRFRITQRNDPDVARLRCGRVQFVDQGMQLLKSGQRGRPQDKTVGTRFRQSEGFQIRISPARIGHMIHQTGQIDGQCMMQGNDLGLSHLRHIEGIDQLGDTPQIFSIVRHHQRIIGRIGGDGVIRRNQGTQHRQQIVGRFITQMKNPRHHLTAPGDGS